MGNYRYQIKTPGGQTQAGVLGGDSGAAAILRNQGGHVLQLHPVSTGFDAGDFMTRLKEFNSGKPRAKHVLDFTTQLAVMMRAGINLRSALEGTADQRAHPTMKKVILQLKSDVESGKPFSAALARHPKLFGPLY